MGSGSGGCNLLCQWIIACGCGAAAYYEAVGLMLYRADRDQHPLTPELQVEFDDLLNEAREYVQQQAAIIHHLTKRTVPVRLGSLFDIAFTIRTFSQMEGFTAQEAKKMVKLAKKLTYVGQQLARVLLIHFGLPRNVDPYLLLNGDDDDSE